MTLDCTRETLATIEPFADERYIRSNASDYMPFYAVDPFAEFEAEHIPLATEHIPPASWRSRLAHGLWPAMGLSAS